MAIVYLGIGSNEGDRQANIQKALDLMKENKEIKILAASSIFETDPEGVPDQPRFFNGAIKISTDLLPLELLSQLKMIERRLGRIKSNSVSPRTMDLDILFYDDVVIVEGKSLTIPHPRVAERRFVLEPLAEIAEDLIHPRLQKTVGELWRSLKESQV